MAASDPHKTVTEGSFQIEDLYNLLMVEIEPDLTTDMLPLLSEMYEGESAENRKARSERYAEAFEEFAIRFDKAMAIWKEQIHKFKEKAFGIARERSGKNDVQALSDIERSFDSSSV